MTNSDDGLDERVRALELTRCGPNYRGLVWEFPPDDTAHVVDVIKGDLLAIQDCIANRYPFLKEVLLPRRLRAQGHAETQRGSHVTGLDPLIDCYSVVRLAYMVLLQQEQHDLERHRRQIRRRKQISEGG